MMSRINVLRVFVVLALLATMVMGGGGSAFAQTQFPAYTSSIQIANLESTEATVTLTAYNPDGTTNGAPKTDPIPANGSKAYFPIANVSNGFQGSIVVSSSKRIAAISNIVTPDFAAGASYVGRSAGDTVVLLPILNQNNGGFFTWFSVQNAGTNTANIQVAYSDGTNTTAQIPVGAAKVFYQQTETHTLKNFSGKVTSDQPVVAAVIQENTKIIFSYTGLPDDATSPTPLIPLVNANNAGYRTGIQVQNSGTQATNVTLSYTPLGSATPICTETRTIPANGNENFALIVFTNGDASVSNCAAGVKFVGSATVTTNSTSQPLVAIVNQLGATDGGAYIAFKVEEATNKVVLPLIMDRNSGFFTGINVQNAGTTATTVTCTFTNATYTVSKLLQPGEALNDLQNGKIADKYVGGATCTATNTTDRIVATVNELRQRGVDELLVYEGATSQ